MKYFESRNPPSRQHAYNTQSRTSTNIPRASSSSTPSKDNNNTHPIKQTQPMRNSQPIQNYRKLYLKYDIIEDMKKIHENISMYDTLQIYPMPNGTI